MTKRIPTKAKPRTGAKRKGADTGLPRSVAVKRPGGKLGLIVKRLEATAGATLDELVHATGWQPHSVRGAISGALKKKLGLIVAAEKVDGRGRVYRITGRG